MSARTATSTLAVTFAGHATVLLELDGVRLLTDPLLRKRIGVLIRRSPVPPASLRRDLDAVLISHAHLDHLDVPSLRLIDRRTPVVVPRGVGGLVRRLGFVPVEMDVGDEVEIGPAGAGGAAGPARVRVQAVPADHAGTRYPLAAEAPALGYVVAGGLSAYFAGDTGLYDGMREFGAASTSPCCPSAAGGRGCPATTSTRCRRPRRSSCCARRPACPSTGAPSTRRGCRRPSTPSGASGRTRSPATRRTWRRRSTCASCSRARRPCSRRGQRADAAREADAPE